MATESVPVDRDPDTEDDLGQIRVEEDTGIAPDHTRATHPGFKGT